MLSTFYIKIPRLWLFIKYSLKFTYRHDFWCYDSLHLTLGLKKRRFWTEVSLLKQNAAVFIRARGQHADRYYHTIGKCKRSTLLLRPNFQRPKTHIYVYVHIHVLYIVVGGIPFVFLMIWSIWKVMMTMLSIYVW